MAKSPSQESSAEREVRESRGSIEDGRFPLRFYGDPDLHELEMERIFGRTWIFVGHEAEIPEPGDYARRYIGTDPFIFVRDEDGNINLLLDSCRHRGTKLCRAERGNTSHFRCPYHGWTYKNTGELTGVPMKEKAYQELDTEEYGLIHVSRLEQYKGLVFASMAEEGPSLEEFLGDFSWYFDILLNLCDGGLEPVGEPLRWEVDTNWKTPADNSQGDSYHTAWAHRSILDLELGGEETVGHAGTGESLDRHVLSDGHMLSTRLIDDEDIWLTYPEDVWDLFDHDDLQEEQFELARQALSFTGSIFPNSTFIYFGDTTDAPGADIMPYFTIRKFRPVAPKKTEIKAWYFVPREAPPDVKDRMYDLCISNFSPAGNFDQDDATVWSGIPDTAKSQMARKKDVDLVFQMTMDEKGMGEQPIDEDWPGPGKVYAENLEEEAVRVFHKMWYDMLLNGSFGGGAGNGGSFNETTYYE